MVREETLPMAVQSLDCRVVHDRAELWLLDQRGHYCRFVMQHLFGVRTLYFLLSRHNTEQMVLQAPDL